MTQPNVHFRDEGARDRAPVVFLHAFPLHGGMWDAQHAALAQQARCISPDMSGLGRSALPRTPNMLEHLVDDLFALLDHLQLSRAVLCGLSMGGYVALRAIERDASRVSGLVLANTQAGADGNEAKLKRADGIRKLRTQGVQGYVDGFLKTALSSATHARSPAVVDAARAMMLQSSSEAMVHGLLAIATRTDTTASLSQIEVPTCVIAGEQDAIVKPQVMRELSERIPGAAYHLLPDVGHLSNLEAPEAFNRLLLEHVARVSG